MAYNLKVDEFSLLKVDGSYEYFKTAKNSTKLMVQASHHASKSFELTYIGVQQLDNSSAIVGAIPIHTAVVVLRDGIVTEVVWDNGCWGCPGDRCIAEMMPDGKPMTNCKAETCVSNGKIMCNAQIYIAFIGSDSKGDYMESGGMRFSRFQSFSVGDLYGRTQEQFASTAQEINKQNNQTAGIVREFSSSGNRILGQVEERKNCDGWLSSLFGCASQICSSHQFAIFSG
eukprot:TRINITY_DN3584_c0_g2_i2.p2 TRINITY_DN3584_c0_g2~~TRINITY_DN3584_c0_g2_i2.p2  ORF type:complete len:229 (+),score=26.02 TRINITY_DN3584_c0_g2_i2:531-1217(+)